MTKPSIITGNIFRDHRGSVSFSNDFTFNKIKRFYIVSNKKVNQFRGWHGHKKEEKYVLVISGKAIVGTVKIDDWKKPSLKLKVHRFSLDATIPNIVYIPAGYANGFKSLTKDTRIMFFSTLTLEQSKNDDIRFSEDYWKI